MYDQITDFERSKHSANNHRIIKMGPKYTKKKQLNLIWKTNKRRKKLSFEFAMRQIYMYCITNYNKIQTNKK